MGLAASQARFLQLTARRSNIEYQGQQINQQRLSLANESAGLLQKQLALTVPTPPSSTDDKYNKPSYDFTDPTDGLKKNIKFTFAADGKTISAYTISYNKYTTDGTYTTYNIKSTDAGSPALTTTALSYVASTNTIVKSGTNNLSTSKTYIDATPTVDSNTGRVSSVIIASTEASSTAFTVSTSGLASLTYSSAYDEKAYNDDMNEYEYKKATYEYEVEKINAQTADIQRQDQALELKMKQLDTEHTAVQTELEAVQKVITTNVEGSYKTFGS
jgi:hypothetical protein